MLHGKCSKYYYDPHYNIISYQVKQTSIPLVKMERIVLLGPWTQESQTSNPLSKKQAP